MTTKNLFGLALVFAWTSHAVGQTWVQANAPTNNNWLSVAFSTNGDRLFAVCSPGGIYTSTNSGFDWTLTSAPTTNWDSVACSANGQNVFATVYGGSLFLSSDAGATWQQSTAPTGTWMSVACSSDGVKVVAAQGDYLGGPNGGFLYISTNSGATWSMSNSLFNSWGQVACSADGTIDFAVGAEVMYRSTNSGVTWDALNQAMGSFVVSEDGERLSGIWQGLYVSTNSGDSGVSLDLPPVSYLGASGDGLGLVAGQVCGPLYTSDDGGTNWAVAPSVYSLSGWALAASPNGAWRIAMAQSGRTWISYVPDSAPFFVQQPPANTVAEQSTTILLQSPVLGSTPMYLQWQCNGTNLVDSDRISGTTNSTLMISNVYLSDAGVYTLVATNSLGSALSQPAQLTVNPDLQRPTLVIYFPTNGQRAAGESFNIEGSATDSVQVAGVWFQLNSGPWCLATNWGSWSNWYGNMPVVPGTNIVRCYAIDLAGNYSVTNNISFTSIIVSLATVTQNGQGRLKPDYNGKLLTVGANYTMRAEPPPGYIFAGWTGDIQSQRQKLTFTMQSNLVLNASYVTNPFPPLAGKYSGVVDVGALKPVPAPPFLFTAVVGPKGAFAAKLTLGKQVFHCSGQFSPTGSAYISFAGPSDFQPNGGTLQLDLSGGGMRGAFESAGLFSGPFEIGATKK